MPAVTPAEVATARRVRRSGRGRPRRPGGRGRACRSTPSGSSRGGRPAARPRRAGCAPVHTETRRSARGAVLAQPVDQARVGATGALAAGDEQGVRGRRVGEGVVRYEGQAAGGAHGSAVQGGGADAVARPGCAARRPAKTSTGPVTSRLCTPSKRTTRTVRCAMPSILGGGGDGRNDEYPTFPAIGSGSLRRLARAPGHLPYRPVGNLPLMTSSVLDPRAGRRCHNVLNPCTPRTTSRPTWAGSWPRSASGHRSAVYFAGAGRRAWGRSGPGAVTAAFYNYKHELVARHVPAVWETATPEAGAGRHARVPSTRRCAGCWARGRRVRRRWRRPRELALRAAEACTRARPAAVRRARRPAGARGAAPGVLARRDTAARTPRRRPSRSRCCPRSSTAWRRW